MNDDPIRRFESVCSLSEEEKRERRQMIRKQLEPHLRRRQKLADGLAFEFDPQARAQVEELVELERECCGPLTIELRDDGERLRLEMRDPPRPRMLRSLGLGTAGSLALFCGVPLALAAAFGSAAVAPLLGLDDPWIVGAGALALGGALLLLERRRHARG